MWNLKCNTNGCLFKTKTDSQRKQACGHQRGEESGEGQIRGMQGSWTQTAIEW